jgi:chitin elicitor receptor kinase 1
VQLIGYCTTNSLFLVYEFVENGTLDQHLHSRHTEDYPPLTWQQRVQISLDAARGLEYIHEHTKPTYIHRDIKSANILIDNSFRAKVADFGLAKLTDSATGTGVVGTFGYMSPEYALYGEVSPKLDVYAFGVVLFEIISGRVAIAAESSSLENRTPREGRTLCSLVGPLCLLSLCSCFFSILSAL